MKYIVYLTTNLVNLHIYVGVHGTENPDIFDGYIGNSINVFKSNPELKNPKLPFYKAVKKYGYSAFKRQTIQVFDTEREALDLEGIIVNEEFIKRKDTYNITLGGGMPPLHNKIIYQYDLNGNFIKEWKSIVEAGNSININARAIGHAANYKRTSGGCLWSFDKYDKLDLTKYHIDNPKIPIYLYNLDGDYIKKYDSISECARSLNTPLCKIQRCAKLGNIVDEYYVSLKLLPKFNKPIFNISGEIHQYDITGKYIRSYQDSKELKNYGYRICEVNRSIKMDSIYKNSIWVRGEKVELVSSKEHNIKIARKVGQYTKDGELIKVFNTLRSAKKEFPNVSKVLNGIAKHCHNYIFKYID